MLSRGKIDIIALYLSRKPPCPTYTRQQPIAKSTPAQKISWYGLYSHQTPLTCILLISLATLS